MINRAEPRACGYSRRSRRLDKKWPETDERQLLRQTKPRKVSEGRRRTRLASSRTGENPPYGMNRGGGGNIGMTQWLFATMPERADTQEAIGLNSDAPPLHSTQPAALGGGGAVRVHPIHAVLVHQADQALREFLSVTPTANTNHGMGAGLGRNGSPGPLFSLNARPQMDGLVRVFLPNGQTLTQTPQTCASIPNLALKARVCSTHRLKWSASSRLG